MDLGCKVAMAEATFRHLTSPAFVTGVAAGAACAALYVRLFPLKSSAEVDFEAIPFCLLQSRTKETLPFSH